jgi:hypothetical protein
MPAKLLWLLSTATRADESSTPLLRSTWALFSIIALLLILFVLVIAGLAVLRSRRRGEQRREAANPGGEVDAWTEAGRRVHGSTNASDDPL